MELVFKGQRVDGGTTATVSLNDRDHVSIGFVGLNGEFQVVRVTVGNGVGVVSHEQTGDNMVIRK